MAACHLWIWVSRVQIAPATRPQNRRSRSNRVPNGAARRVIHHAPVALPITASWETFVSICPPICPPDRRLARWARAGLDLRAPTPTDAGHPWSATVSALGSGRVRWAGPDARRPVRRRHAGSYSATSVGQLQRCRRLVPRPGRRKRPGHLSLGMRLIPFRSWEPAWLR